VRWISRCVLQCVAVYDSVLQCFTVCYGVMHCLFRSDSVCVRYKGACCSVALCCSVFCSV